MVTVLPGNRWRLSRDRRSGLHVFEQCSPSRRSSGLLRAYDKKMVHRPTKYPRGTAYTATPQSALLALPCIQQIWFRTASLIERNHHSNRGPQRAASALTSALAYELVAFMSLWVSQTDPAIWRASWRCQESSRCATPPRDAGILTQVVAKTPATCTGSPGRSAPSTASAAAAPPSPWTRSSPPGRTPRSASPPALGTDPHDPSPNSRRSVYSLPQWRDSQHLLFDREPARWTSNEQR